MAVQLVKAHERADAIEGMFKINQQAMVRQTPRTTGDPHRLLRIAFNAIVYDNDLMACTPVSLLGGVMEALKLGITLGGPMQEGWLLPFRDSQQGGAKVATLIVGYQGYRNIIDRGRSVLDMHPYAVYKGDDFDFELGSHPRIKHKPYWMCGAEQGELQCVYCVAHLRGGGMQLEVMPIKEVEQHKARSRAAQSGRSPWKTDYDAMALKTVVRKISKYLPKSSELLARALDLDDKADRGVSQDFDISGLVVPPALQEGPADVPKPAGSGKLGQLTQTLQNAHPLGGQKEGPEGALMSEEESRALDRELHDKEGRR